MLPRQQRRRHHDRHLLAGHGGGEGRPQCDFSFAKAHIAADQPVHRLGLRKIGNDIANGVLLILGFLVGEARGKFVIKTRRRDRRFRRLEGAGRSHRDELIRNLADALFHLRFTRLPGPAAQLVQLHFRIVRAVAGQKLDVFDGQIELVIARIEDQQAVMGRALHLDGFKAGELADAMIHMHHIVTLAEA